MTSGLQAPPVQFHPSQDRSGRFSVDALIRSKGYKIVYRRSGEEPIWEDARGNRYLQKEIIDRMNFDELAKAQDAEISYYRQKRKGAK